MAYCTLEDIEKSNKGRKLVDLTDTEGTGEIDDVAVDKAIAWADAKINSYCAVRYTVPMSPAPDVIKDCSASLEHYKMKKDAEVLTEDDKADFKNELAWLDRVMKTPGMLDTAENAPAESAASGARSTTSGKKKVMTTGDPGAGTTGSLDDF